jgi:itaconate CoA-transferase
VPQHWTARRVLSRAQVNIVVVADVNGPRENDSELTAILEASFANLSAEEVTRLLERAGIANARLRTPEEFTCHPQLRARDRWRRVRAPGGDIDALLSPVEVAGQEPVMGPVPALGEHTEAVRAEFGAASRKDLSA